MADTLVLEASARKGVKVRVLSVAPNAQVVELADTPVSEAGVREDIEGSNPFLSTTHNVIVVELADTQE